MGTISLGTRNVRRLFGLLSPSSRPRRECICQAQTVEATPGTHDSLAVTLSMMAQALGFSGLLLVPIGVPWLIYELMKRTEMRGSPHAIIECLLR